MICDGKMYQVYLMNPGYPHTLIEFMCMDCLRMLTWKEDLRDYNNSNDYVRFDFEEHDKLGGTYSEKLKKYVRLVNVYYAILKQGG